MAVDSGEQGAQHSQAFHAIYSHVPGLKVVMPATPYDAKGLMIAAIKDPDPVVFIDDRWLYGQTEHVPEHPYEVPIGKAAIRREGSDLTIAAISYMVSESLAAAGALAQEGIEAEVLDLRSAKPIDEEALLHSVRKTGRLIIADGGWLTGGFAAEVAARVAEKGFGFLKAPIKRVALPDCPAPASRALEQAFFRTAPDIVRVAKELR